MPLYDYECLDCGATKECLFKVDEKPDRIECEKCYSTMGSIIVLGHGGFHSDTPGWIDDEVRGCLQDEAEKPIETRKDLAAVLKKRKAEPIETSHKGLRMI